MAGKQKTYTAHKMFNAVMKDGSHVWITRDNAHLLKDADPEQLKALVANGTVSVSGSDESPGSEAEKSAHSSTSKKAK